MNIMELQRFDFTSGRFVLRDTKTKYKCGCSIGSPFHWAEEYKPKTSKTGMPAPPRSADLNAVNGIYTYTKARQKEKK